MSTPTPGASAPRSGRVVDIAVIGVSAIALIALFMWLGGFSPGQDSPEGAGSSNSSGPRGALALYKWLEKSGFDVTRTGAGDTFPPPSGTLLMINPNGDFPTGQAADVRRWVEDGNTLVLAMGQFGGDISSAVGGRHPMLRELGIGLSFTSGYTPTLPVAQPLFSAMPVSSVRMPGLFSLSLPITNTVVLASATESGGTRVPLAAMIRAGKGQIFVLSSDYPLSNQGLGVEDNGAFVYNLVQAGGRRVAFDEAHHGASSGGDLVALLTGNPWGWAIIYALIMGGMYIIWSARRLGPPLPVQTPDQRRPTSEYVTAVAGLFRRARKPGYAAERYLQYFKRTLSRHAELDPYLTDANFVQSLSERGRYPFNPDEMRQAIERLRALEGVGEGSGAPESVELDTLKAIREAESVRRQALGLREAEN